jgi:hypothetical protein
MFKKRLENLTLIILSIIISLIVIELAIRIYAKYRPMIYEIEMYKYAKELKIISEHNKEKFLTHKPLKKNITIMGAKINTDENGFRENEITVNKNLPKIVLLGDSMTFGFGSKITFADYLQRKFYKDFKIENMGVGNTNTIMEINQFFYKYENLVKNTEKKGGGVNIKYVILNFYINDLEIINLKTNNNFYKDLYLYNLVNYKIKLSKDFNYVDYYKKTFLNKNVKEDTFKKILLLNSYSKQKNFIFLFNFIPDLRNPQNYQFHEEENQIKLFLDNNNIPYIDNLEKFLDKKPLDYWVSTSDPHPNELGHYLLSLNLISYIEKSESLKNYNF